MNSSRVHKSATTSSSSTVAAKAQVENIVVDDLNYALMSPPTSTSSGGALEQVEDDPQTKFTYPEVPWKEMDMGFVPHAGVNDLDFWGDSSWANQPFQAMMGTPGDLPDNEVTYPDTSTYQPSKIWRVLTYTAISFNASLPTLQYYSWLFGNDIATNDTDNLPPVPNTYLSGESNTHSTQEVVTVAGFESSLHEQISSAEAYMGKPSRDRSSHLQPRSQHSVLSTPESGRGYSTINSPAMTVSPISGAVFSHRPSAVSQAHSNEFGALGVDNASLYFSSRNDAENTNREGYPPPRSINSSPSDAWIRTHPKRLPMISIEARDGLLQLISQARPTRMDQSEISLCDPLLSLAALQCYSDLFFIHFNSTYPMIHPGTFSSSAVHPLKLMSIILLGATYSDTKAHTLAICLHDMMRPLIHSHKEFGPRPTFWMLQTILLVECFGKSRAGERQHDVSNIYHGLQIK